MYEGLLESEGKSLFDEVERQDSRIQREVVAADMERMPSCYTEFCQVSN